MSTRENILKLVKQNQPPSMPLPEITQFKGKTEGIVDRFIETARVIGSKVYAVNSMQEIEDIVRENFEGSGRLITSLPELNGVAELFESNTDPHNFQDVELAIIRAAFSVAENGAIWLNETLMGHRIIPYICQHLAVVIRAESIVDTLHEAYAIIGQDEYGFGGYIGGPSKTADIEQALVMGAHGPITMTMFVLS